MSDCATRLRAIVTSGAAFLGIALSLAPAASASAISTSPPCGSSYDPYDYTASALQSCGVTISPQTSVTSLSDGGSSYNYDAGNGVVSHMSVPPANFDPQTASNSELGQYGLPPRPTTPQALANWDSQFSHATWAAPPSFLAELPNVTADTVYSSNWSGYAATGGRGTFTSAEAAYYEPSFGSTSCTNNAEVTWSGIGGYSASGLGQAGTSHNVPGLANHQAWYEVYPLEGIIALSLVPGAGQEVISYTSYSSGTYSGFVQNVTAGTIVGWSQSGVSGYYNGTSAEAIAERPTISGSYAALSNFGTMTFLGSYGNGSGLDGYSSRHAIHMNDGNDLADPSNIGSGGSFTDSQHHCS